MKKYFSYLSCEPNKPVIDKKNRKFLLLVQHAVLLSLKDTGNLSPTQYFRAEAALVAQHRGDCR